ncbi:phytyl ester synthase 2, chloroplastic-like [Salvia miltiorrhiza]|uniref:phytyl ester synthase 2, chloroplastic-like n=1 Tax=Salvia miltiorrhiza TaxID=226208 RepID=UPI0025ACE4D5|nr:phytyl ester synthase 2, chloroplastic-like [Salvia miltiorrhiza]
MAATAAFAAVIWPLTLRQRYASPTTGKFRSISKPELSVYASAVRKEKQPRELAPSVSDSSAVGKKPAEEIPPSGGRGREPEAESDDGLSSLKNYFDQCREFISKSDGGPPRWFSPLECRSQLKDSPLLLYLPGVDGVGLGLMMEHERLGKIFDIWCMHIPLKDRTPLTDLVKFVESTVKTEHLRVPNRPIYLVGESFGACLALAVAACNPEIDLPLILANPATSFGKSLLQPLTLLPLSAMMPEKLSSSLPYVLTLLLGNPAKMVAAAMSKHLPLDQVIEVLSQESVAISSYLSTMSKLFTVETLCWKLNLLKSAAAFANSRLHAVKAQTLILASGQDKLLPSRDEANRLCQVLQKCQVRLFANSGHALFLEMQEHGFSLASILTGASFYRRGERHNYVSDYLPPTPSEFWRIYELQRWIETAVNPVVLSTLENGDIVRSLAGIPSEGPVLYVGYHMMLGFEVVPLLARFWIERNILLRGMTHPMVFTMLREGIIPPPLSAFDNMKIMGAVPVSATNFYRLLSSNSHVLLYPGGMRESLHRKGEEYKLFWPEQPEFVRVAAKFGAKIVPFGVVGEDDIGHLLLDYNDLTRIPYIKNAIEELTEEVVKLRSDAIGEVANENVHLPVIIPKVPGRFYFLFGKPIETEGRKQKVRSREKAQELYLEVKSEVEKCLAYLKEKRENDPYRHIVARLTYQAIHGFDSEVPTFDFTTKTHP